MIDKVKVTLKKINRNKKLIKNGKRSREWERKSQESEISQERKRNREWYEFRMNRENQKLDENSILQLFPMEERIYFVRATSKAKNLSEIRIRVNQPVILVRENRWYRLGMDGMEYEEIDDGWRANELQENEGAGYVGKDIHCNKTKYLIFGAGQIEQIINQICRFSPYAYKEELRKGYITVPKGHRIGVCGQVLMNENTIAGMRNISFLNIRIAHQIRGAADEVVPYLYNQKKNAIYSCLIIGAPGKGKTTLLRDLIRQISDGTRLGRGRNIGVVDERGEIAGCYMGIPQNDVGIHTDILDGCDKAYGMEMILRSMAEDIAAVDEIATSKDVDALLLLMHCGVNVFATIHGDTISEVKNKPYMERLFKNQYFERIICIKHMDGKIKYEIQDANGHILNM